MFCRICQFSLVFSIGGENYKVIENVRELSHLSKMVRIEIFLTFNVVRDLLNQASLMDMSDGAQ